MVTYKQRIRKAMGPGGPTNDKVHALAKALDVTYQAVKKLVDEDGKTNMLSAENNAKAAKHLRVDSDWLATGEGRMVTERVWPFALLTPEQLTKLPDVHLQTVEKLALDLLQMSQTSPARSGNLRWVDGELVEGDEENDGKSDSDSPAERRTRRRS